MNLSVLGISLQSIRKSKGLTRDQVAERSGGAVSASWLNKVERGEVENPSLKHLEILAGVYRLTLVDLIAVAGEKEVGDDFLLRFSMPKGVRLKLEDIEAAKPIMQEVLNAITRQRHATHGSGSGDDGEGNS